MTYPKISIIIPVYKAESTISRCVDSILAQTYPEWELILIDDGSPDKSGEICDKYAMADNRIKVIHTANGGAGSARNHGLDNCHSQWITFVDSDDSLEPAYLANFHLPSHCNESGTLIMQGYRRVNPAMEELDEKIELKNATYSGNQFLDKAFLSDKLFEYGQVVGKLYNTGIIQKANIRFTTDFQLSEDHLFYLTYLSNYVTKIITYSGTLYNYIWDDSIGLSRRNHPYYDMYCRYSVLLDICNRLKSKHELCDENIQKIDYFAVTCGLSILLKALYMQEASTHIRTDILRNILYDKNIIRSAFKPNSLNGKILKLSMSYFPICITDLFLRIAIKH